MVPPTAHKATQPKKMKKTTTAPPKRRRGAPAARPLRPKATSGTEANEAPNSEAPGATVTAQRNPMEEKTLTVKEAAFRLRKSPDAIYGWLHSGRLRGWQPGGPRCPILVEESSLNEALRFNFSRASAGRGARIGNSLWV